MDLKKTIVEFGTEGVLRYREISQSRHDNELPEVFLGSFIAPRLYDLFKHPVRVEAYYSVLAQEAGLALTGGLLTELGGLRADIAISPPSDRVILVELKILDEATQPSSIANDLSKMAKLTQSGKLLGYVGTMICETATQGLDTRVGLLEQTLRTTIYRGITQQSTCGNWTWCFGCAAVK
jgi:hypothetical protein